MEQKKIYQKKWFIGLMVVLGLAFIGSMMQSTTSFTAEATYSQEAVEKGTPTGYKYEGGTGTFVVGDDIEPGLYNISNIGWADMITVESTDDAVCADPNLISADEDGVVENVTLSEGCQIDILDQDNDSAGFSDTGSTQKGKIMFTQVEPKTIEAKEITETLTIDTTDNSEVCTKDNETVECSSLTKYDELKADIDGQINS